MAMEEKADIFPQSHPMLQPISSGCGTPLMSEKLVVIMVGLPARGKTYIATKLAYYLNWIMVKCRVFNLGRYRRRKFGPESPAQFFHPDNVEGQQKRKELAVEACNDIVEYLRSGGVCAVFDATNSTRDRRQLLADELGKRNVPVFFVESVCDDDDRIHRNIMQVKVGLPDYTSSSVEEAVSDFKQRISYYKLKYETLDPAVDLELSFMKMVDVGRYFLIQNIQGYLQMRIARFLMNIHVEKRAIYISRHGESMFNTKGLIGGDSDLSPRGREYAKRLRTFMAKENLDNLRVWCSTLKRTLETVENFDNVESWKALDELDAGECDGMTYQETQAKFPDFYEERTRNKYWTRYPRGESYADVVQRLEPRIVELERMKGNVLVVCHQAVARCLLAYFRNINDLADELPYMKINLHTVFKITPIPYGNRIEVFDLGVDAVDTHVPRKDSPPATPDIPATRVEEGVFVPGPPEVTGATQQAMRAGFFQEETLSSSILDSMPVESYGPDLSWKPANLLPRARPHQAVRLGNRRGVSLPETCSFQQLSDALPALHLNEEERSLPISPQHRPSQVIQMSPQQVMRGLIHNVKVEAELEDAEIEDLDYPCKQ
eukprot:TRINITY_DN4514_c0_g1_i1.p1 TRINITY_DN4514_c0_g1~~TRINITY_DN4514_c0_g1_i1.p1  ORF type:complete len:604 (+),score=125.36 TRINITY_DN4514_c0_g1_i1:155-1966(+)